MIPPALRAAVRTALRLGRVSNLPTVWTNLVVGIALNGGAPSPAIILPLLLAGSLFYVAGMFLNDAYDHRWDSRFRPERPIPAGMVRLSTVFAAGYGMMAAGITILYLGLSTKAPAVVGLALCGLIVLYDKAHKGNPFSPIVMGLCRVCLYVVAALAVAPRLGGAVYLGAALLLAYLVGLSSLAKREAARPQLGRLVGALIAGISLLDAVLLLACGHRTAAALAVGAFALTRLLQRKIAGT
jgi:4-hydroxybenzoate polyprenyltransferase